MRYLSDAAYSRFSWIHRVKTRCRCLQWPLQRRSRELWTGQIVIMAMYTFRNLKKTDLSLLWFLICCSEKVTQTQEEQDICNHLIICLNILLIKISFNHYKNDPSFVNKLVTSNQTTKLKIRYTDWINTAVEIKTLSKMLQHCECFTVAT